MIRPCRLTFCDARLAVCSSVCLLVQEDRPYPRVRVIRANMGPKTVVKEMSEQLILDRLKKDVKAWIITQPKA